MPHVNVLDLVVFPSMSKRHSHLARAKHGNRVLKEDEIWDTALQVWENLPSCKIANSFVQAKRICEKIIKCGGNNDFLSGCKGGISCEVRKNFDDTFHGNKRKDGLKLTFEEGLIGVIDECKAELDEISNDAGTMIQTLIGPLPPAAPAENARSDDMTGGNVGCAPVIDGNENGRNNTAAVETTRVLM